MRQHGISEQFARLAASGFRNPRYYTGHPAGLDLAGPRCKEPCRRVTRIASHSSTSVAAPAVLAIAGWGRLS